MSMTVKAMSGAHRFLSVTGICRWPIRLLWDLASWNMLYSLFPSFYRHVCNRIIMKYQVGKYQGRQTTISSNLI